MITDRQIEAAVKAYSDDVMSDTNPNHIYRDKHKSGMRAALEAAEKLIEQEAWCFDMDKAPRDGTWVLVSCVDNNYSYAEYACWCHFWGGWRDAHDEPIGIPEAWRHLPSLPTQEGTR